MIRPYAPGILRRYVSALTSLRNLHRTSRETPKIRVWFSVYAPLDLKPPAVGAAHFVRLWAENNR